MKRFLMFLLVFCFIASSSSFAYFNPDSEEYAIEFEGATADDYETTLAITDPTADRTVTIPDASGTVSLVNSDETSTGTKTLYGLTTTGPVTIASASITTASITTPTLTNTTNNGTLTVKGTSTLNGSVTVSSGTVTATIVTASLNASSGTIVRFPIAASTAVSSGATAGSLKIVNNADDTAPSCTTTADGGVGTTVVVCVSDGTNWIKL